MPSHCIPVMEILPLYTLVLNKIQSYRGTRIHHSVPLPKTILRDIARLMHNSPNNHGNYFSGIVNNSDSLTYLLLSGDDFSEYDFIRFLQQRSDIRKELIASFLNKRTEQRLESASVLGGILKIAGDLPEAEHFLNHAAQYGPARSIALSKILQQLLHVQTLMEKDSDARETYDRLQQELDPEETSPDLISVYNGCASYQLTTGYMGRALFWNQKSLDAMTSLTPLRDRIEVFLVSMQIYRIRREFQQVDDCLTRAVIDWNRLYTFSSWSKFYRVKIMKEAFLTLAKIISFGYYRARHYSTESRSIGQTLRVSFLLRYHNDNYYKYINGIKWIGSQIIDRYRHFLGHDHVITKRVEREIETAFGWRDVEFELDDDGITEE